MTGESLSTPVLIAGGGPVGITLAIELGQRGVDCILLNDNLKTAQHPKANAISSRSMEHFRRLGIAKTIRSAGLDDDHPTDVAYFTSLDGYEIGRLEQPSRRDALRDARTDQSPWASPEPPHRLSQIFLERKLKQMADRLDSIDVRFGWSLESFHDDENSVSAVAHNLSTDTKVTIQARYLIGCDGPTSIVRKMLGIEYEGESGVVRPMFGGPMFATYFETTEDLSWVRQSRAWQYWIVNPEIRAVFVHVDSKGKFVFHFAVHNEAERETPDPRKYIYKAAGREFPLKIISTANWTAGFALVAQRYQQGNVFIAGDAAHLFTPTGGMGMNTGVDDAVNLGWKLAAVLKGWAHPNLLDSYDAERRPIGERNVEYARKFADSVGSVEVSKDFIEDTPAGDAERSRMSQYHSRHAFSEFIIPGVFLGLNYARSPIIEYGKATPPPDHPNKYEPNTCPGSRAPHAWVGREPLFDRFGREFTLLSLTSDDSVSDTIRRAANEAKMPLNVVKIRDHEISALYVNKYTLIRPDQHVAWRGDSIPYNPAELLAKVRGSGH